MNVRQVLSQLILSEVLLCISDNINKMKTPSSLRIRRKDFSQGGFHTEPHDFHRLWFEFMLLSPSYELARRFRASNGNLSPSDQARLPADFDQVLDVFDDFGDLQRSLFRPWLLERGLRLFGAPGAKPQPKLLHRFRDGDEQEVEAASQIIKHYVDSDWKKQNRPEALLLAVPLNLSKQQILKELKKLLDDNIQDSESREVGKYKLANKGMHRQNVVDALAVLYVRAARPDFKLWQVGVEAKISDTYSKLFDAKTSKRTANNATDFRILEMMTSRKLRLAKNLVENAARGRFPDQTEPEHTVEFDPKEFNKIIADHIRWKKNEVKKYS